MKFNEPKVEFIQIDFKNSFICTSPDPGVCTPNDGVPGGGWSCSNNAWSYNNCLDEAPVVC